MDYTQAGQPGNIDKRQPFFTAGAGVESTEENSFEPENNLDLTNSAWGETPKRDSRSMGENILSLSGNETPSPNRQEEELRRLGQIVDLEMPPDVAQTAKNESAPEPITPEDSPAEDDVNFDHLVAERDNISPQALKTTEKAVSNFESGKITPAELNDIKWKSTRAYLKNSFGRELGE